MSKPRDTPAPWDVVVHDKFTTVEGRYCTVTNDVSNDDAHILSAAPEMLEALKLCLRSLEELDIASSDTVERDTDAMQAARKAIAKAEGKSK